MLFKMTSNIIGHSTKAIVFIQVECMKTPLRFTKDTSVLSYRYVIIACGSYFILSYNVFEIQTVS